MFAGKRMVRLVLLLSLSILAVPMFAQQVGEIAGRVTATDGSVLPGVTVEAKSPILPQSRTTVTNENGEYRLPVLPPGMYNVTFSLAGMQTVSRDLQVLLSQTATVNVSLGMQGVSEEITVTAATSLVDPESTAIKSALGQAEIKSLPLGQDYRDLLRLAPSVQITEDTIRGPSAGGSGQDNVYQFDGVNITLPLFGTLSAEPSTHDVAQMSVIKGGAKAVDFNRAAGFTIDTVSKSGTNELMGQVSFQYQNDSMRGDATTINTVDFKQTKTWATVNAGGPVLPDRVFFYGSYYRPTLKRTDRTNAYGDVPDLDSTRNEYFGKLTATPTSKILMHGSYRHSERAADNASISSLEASSRGLDEESTLKIGIFEGSWVFNERSFASWKFTDYQNNTLSVPNNVLGVVPNITLGTKIDINALETLGALAVPCPIGRPSGAKCQNGLGSSSAVNTFLAPFIDKYGFLDGGVRTGSGGVGAGLEINDQDFGRRSGQAAYEFTLGSKISHDLHVGYQWMKDSEDLTRSSNGWGSISVTGGNVKCPAAITSCAGMPVFFQAQFTRSLFGGTGGNLIHSEYVAHNVEFNDTIRWNNWSFNVGVMANNDILYGQGLREDSSALSGYVSAPGNKYKMYEIDWEKTIQPRLGVTWAYNGVDNVYASYAKYVPQASSLPRAASWDRNILGLTYRAHFDATGTLIGVEQVSASSGKLFVDDLDPRYTDEFLIGTSQQFNNQWTARAYARYRYSTNFWEDTNNDARVRWGAAAGVPTTLYIPDLSQKLAQIGSGSSYVITELDGAFSKYYEATMESDWRGGKTFLRGSYTWSHYYGNFDQDNTSLTNDLSLFIGSSNIADGAGRQLWDNKYGDLRGDRRHLLKLYGTYNLPWNATIGSLAIYQSGQPWATWNYEVPRAFYGAASFGSSTSDTDRFAEPAGRNRSPSHYQVDLTYTHHIPINRYNVDVQLDLFNLLDKQTGYDIDPSFHSTNYGRAREFFDPRRFEVTVRFDF